MEAKDIKKIAVVGAGVIGSSWATNLIWKGYPVNLWLYKSDTEEEVENVIRSNLKIMASNGIFLKEKIPIMMRLVNYTSSLKEAVKDVQFILEAVLEDLELKRKILAEIDNYADPNAIFATSSSKLLISEITKHSRYIHRCISAHPYNPPHLIPLVEITKPIGGKKAKKTAEIAAAFFKSINKEPIILKKEVPGYIGNQIQDAVSSKCSELLQNGVCTVSDIDTVINFGPGLRWAAMGPYLIFQLGGGLGGIKGIMLHIGLESLKRSGADEQAIKVYKQYADFVQGEVNKELESRSPEFGNDNETLREFRDKILITLLKLHKKI